MKQPGRAPTHRALLTGTPPRGDTKQRFRRIGRGRRLLGHLGFALSVALAGGASACRTSSIGPPPAAPRATSAVDAIPADLDVVVRLDLAQMRESLGSDVAHRLEEKATRRAGNRERALLEAMKSANVVWLALRPGLSDATTDNVIVLKGHFDGFRPEKLEPKSEWQSPRDLGGAWRLYERRAGKSARSAPVRIYAHGEELLAFVSEAEIDSTRRAIEAGIQDAKPEAPERGVISIAARVKPLANALRGRAERARKFLRGGRELTAYVDLQAGGLTGAASLGFELPEDAQRAAEAIRIYVELLSAGDGAAARLAQQLKVEAVNTSVSLRLEMDALEFGAFLGCLYDADACS